MASAYATQSPPCDALPLGGTWRCRARLVVWDDIVSMKSVLDVGPLKEFVVMQSTVDTLARCRALALAAMPVPGRAAAPRPPRCDALLLAAMPGVSDAEALACFSEKGRAFILAVLDRLP